MTLLAVTFLHYIVNVGPGEDLLFKLRVAFNALLAFEGPLLCGIGILGEEEEPPGQDDRQYCRKKFLW
jgi:hypothetical protein